MGGRSKAARNLPRERLDQGVQPRKATLRQSPIPRAPGSDALKPAMARQEVARRASLGDPAAAALDKQASSQRKEADGKASQGARGKPTINLPVCNTGNASNHGHKAEQQARQDSSKSNRVAEPRCPVHNSILTEATQSQAQIQQTSRQAEDDGDEVWLDDELDAEPASQNAFSQGSSEKDSKQGLKEHDIDWSQGATGSGAQKCSSNAQKLFHKSSHGKSDSRSYFAPLMTQLLQVQPLARRWLQTTLKLPDQQNEEEIRWLYNSAVCELDSRLKRNITSLKAFTMSLLPFFVQGGRW